jgi:hypothetical protein
MGEPHLHQPRPTLSQSHFHRLHLLTEKNRGKELKVPESPKAKVLLHENAAIPYGKSFSTSKDGKSEIRW